MKQSMYQSINEAEQLQTPGYPLFLRTEKDDDDDDDDDDHVSQSKRNVINNMPSRKYMFVCKGLEKKGINHSFHHRVTIAS